MPQIIEVVNNTFVVDVADHYQLGPHQLFQRLQQP